MTEALINLLAAPIGDTAKAIKPLLARGAAYAEYGDAIADYGVVLSDRTDQLIEPYDIYKTHGENVYDDIINLILLAKVKRILDLGCGSGQLLAALLDAGFAPQHLYGCTIHLGEVAAAREKGLTSVFGGDLREMGALFEPNSLDAIVASWSFNHIPPGDREEVVRTSMGLLRSEGWFFGRDYFGEPETAIPVPDLPYKRNLATPSTFGNLICLQKG